MLTARPRIPPLGEIGAVPFNAAIKEEKKRKKKKKKPSMLCKILQKPFFHYSGHRPFCSSLVTGDH